MYKGKVIREFVDRETKRIYRPGDTYVTNSAKRRDQIIATGEARGVVYVKFEEPKKPKGEKGKTAAAEGDKAQQAGATGDDGLADDGQGDDTKGDGAEE